MRLAAAPMATGGNQLSMSALDWMIVLLANGAIILAGVLRSRDTRTSADWFLAGRTLPWWMIGLSLYATVIDSGDLVADAGGTYAVGMSYMLTNWVGVTAGWYLLAHRFAVPMYRRGMYTNAEYLEARFGLATRIASALVQALYRTLVLGIVATTLYLVLAIVGNLGSSAWWCVGAIAACAAVYTSMGGLKSVALTDALQSGLMVAGSVALFVAAWAAAGGWDGAAGRLDAHQEGLSKQLLHVGSDNVARQSTDGDSLQQVERRLLLGGTHDPAADEIVSTNPAWLVALAWIIMGLSYATVNHTQSMRILGARTEWDMKMSVVLAGVVLIVLTFTNLTVGIMGRALYPDPNLMPLDTALQVRDSTFPLLVRELTSTGVRGLVVAGIVASAFSTLDSIGSTVPSLLVRDIYARLLVTDRDDAYYVRASRMMTPLVILGSFGFVPLLLQEKGMLLVLLDWVGAFVVPLLAVHLMGEFTRAHRSSAAIGLTVGIVYGTLKLLAPAVALRFGIALLPAALVNEFASPVFSLALTAGVMVAVTAIRGTEASSRPRDLEPLGWLRSSQLAALALHVATERRGTAFPALLGAAVVVLGTVLGFVVFW